MIITFGQARKIVAQFAGKSGKCAESEDARLFTLDVIQRLLFTGANGADRKWSFHLCNGVFTAPNDLEIPLKVKIDGYPDHVWSRWYEFSDALAADCQSREFKSGFIEEPNQYFTVYDLPATGARIVALPIAEEDADVRITIQGFTAAGQDIYTECDGQTIHGIQLAIQRNPPKRSSIDMARISGIEKSITKDYVRLYWQKLNDAGTKIIAQGFLTEIAPSETHPSLRRFKVPGARCDCPVKVTVLGKVKMMDYRHDNDIIPITNLGSLRQMAQYMQAQMNLPMDANGVRILKADMKESVDDENEYNRTGDDPINFTFETSPGANGNLQ